MSRDMSTQGAAILAAGSGAEFKQTVVITGASRGIGLEFARQLLQAGGYRVVATCRRPKEAHELQRLASEMPGRMIGPLPLDVTDGASVLRAVESVTAQATAVHLGACKASRRRQRRVGREGGGRLYRHRPGMPAQLSNPSQR